MEERFSQLIGQRADIEARFGGELSWEPLEGRRAIRIATRTPGDVTQADHVATAEAFRILGGSGGESGWRTQLEELIACTLLTLWTETEPSFVPCLY